MTENILAQGVVDERTYDLNTPIDQAPPTEPQYNEVKITVPAAIDKTTVESGVKLGVKIISRCQKSIATFCFMQSQKGPDGKVFWSVGTVEMGCLDENDVKRVITVINAINKANTEMLATAKNGSQASDLAAVSLAATHRKDGAVEAMANPNAKPQIIQP